VRLAQRLLDRPQPGSLGTSARLDQQGTGLSHDAYLKFIEDDFLGGQRLDPRTDGRPDPRPDVREADPRLGDLQRDFNFAQRPRRALIMAPRPA